MGKITKGFLIAAVVLILFGLVLFAGGAAAGGIYYSGNSVDKVVHNVLKDEDYHLTIDEEGVQVKVESDDSRSTYDGWQESSFSSQEVKSLKIDISKAEVEIIENESSQEFSVYTDGGKFSIDVKNGVLKIKSDSKLNENKLSVKIPADFEFSEVDISAGAASVEIPRILARKLDVEIGAGSVEVGEISAEEAEFDIGAGEILVSNGNVEKCSVDVDLGDFQYDGIITRECDVECGMGNADIRLEGKEEDYNYEIECSAGNVDIDGRNYSGLAFEQFINNHAKATMEIECSMGNVTIEFNGDSYEIQNYNGQHHEEQHHSEF